MRFILMLATAMLVLPAQAGDTVYTRGELDALVQSMQSRQQKPVTDDVAVIRKHLDAPPGDPLTEYRLRASVLALELPLDADTHDVVAELARRKPSIRVWHDQEGHAPVAEFAFDAGAAARWVLQQSRTRSLAKDMRAGVMPKNASVHERAAAAEWLAGHIDDGGLENLSTQFEEAFNEGAPFENALLAVAVRRNDPQLALRVIDKGDASRLVHQLQNVQDAFPEHREALLTRALQRPVLASHAVSLLGANIDTAWAWNLLMRTLADPSLGATAALALAKNADNAQLAAIAQRLHEPSPVNSRAALALYLNGGDYARQLLEQYRQTAGDTPLAEEIDAWLD